VHGPYTFWGNEWTLEMMKCWWTIVRMNVLPTYANNSWKKQQLIKIKTEIITVTWSKAEWFEYKNYMRPI
jgi:hypothetical protein